MDLLKYKVYRNDSELVAAFIEQRQAERFIENERTFDDWKIVENGKIIYNTEDNQNLSSTKMYTFRYYFFCL